MKTLGLKKKLGGVLLSLVVAAVAVVSPVSTMTVKAALDKPAGYCESNPDKIHFHILEINGEEVKIQVYDPTGTVATSDDESIACFPGAEVGDWFYRAGTAEGIVKCTGNHSAPEEPSSDDKEDNGGHDSGSNDDDSRPAPPTPHQSAQTSIYSSVDTQLAKIDASADGHVIVDGKDLVNALPNTTMQKIAEKPNAVVFFTYTYNGAKYTTAIPGSSVDTSIEWYGPIYMMTHFPTMWHQDANTSVPVVAPVQ